MTPQRCPDAVHETVYGRGYATFRMRREPIELELTAFIPPDQPAEIRLLTIRNHGAEAKRFRVVPYFEMALAELPTDTQGRLQVRTDTGRGAFYFRNPRNDFHHGWAFVATTLRVEHQEHVRQRFLGGPERDASLPYLVEHGASDAQARDDGRRIAGFVGTVEVPAGGRGPGRRRARPGAGAGAGRGHGRALRLAGDRRAGARRHACASGRRPWASCGSRPTSPRSIGWSTTGCPTSC